MPTTLKGSARKSARIADESDLFGAPPESKADAAARLGELREAATGCRNCPLWEHATQTVWGEGAANVTLMLVGEQPGDKEDLAGKSFVGPAGKVLDRAFDELGWSRSELYVTNAVKHFKFEMRGTRHMHKTPGQREAQACLPWLQREIAVVRPKAIVALGAVAARSLISKYVSGARGD